MTALPVASARQVRRHVLRLVLGHPGRLAAALVLHGLAAGVGTAVPRLLGDLVEDVQAGRDGVSAAVVGILGFVVGQSLLLGAAVYRSAVLAELVVAELREDFVRDVLDTPLSRIERAGVGDLVTRSTRDVDTLAQTVRSAVPSAMISLTTIIVILGALLLIGWVAVVPCLLAVPVLVPAVRWYLVRARPGYLAERASYAGATEVLAETVEGAATVEALGTGRRRVATMRDAVAVAYRAERATLRLRTVFLPISDTVLALPAVATVVLGGLLHLDGAVSLAAVTAATLYAQQLAGQFDVLLYQQDKLQLGGAALARLLGVGGQPPRPVTAAPVGPPAAGDRDLVVRGVGFAYPGGADVLHGIDCVIRAGERVAVVGPSGAGKTTLGRLIAGVDRPRTGSVTIGGVPLAALPAARLRSEIALVSQEYHVFAGSIRDNLTLAGASVDLADLRAVLAAVGALSWVEEIGIDTPVGSGGRELSPGQAQQLSLARLLLADPHTLVLDEATALLDPRAARDLERSLAAVLTGRTVISIAHRLHTAHDADRVLVMVDGRIVEDGSPGELVRAGGVYARLWDSWHGTPEQPRRRL